MSLRSCSLAIALITACGTPPSKERERESLYVGVERCGQCHDAAFAFWNNTPHARAFFTLAKAGKTADPACVGCHVTGYGKPGGHSGSRASGLEAVQCEVCHGPGSHHAETESLDAITTAPKRALCVTCHRPPQVPADWDLERAWLKVLGPGHGGSEPP